MSKPSSTAFKSSPSLEKVIEDLKTRKYKNIVFMVGAGISTAAGIPDFRTPGTGLYDNLEKLDLPYPEAVFDIGFFKKNPTPFYTLAKELYPGQFEPTDFHRFMKWVENEGMLRRVYTQNIDTLERIVGISEDKIIEAHGSFAGDHCVECGYVPGQNYVRELVLGKSGVEIPKCPECKGLIKPDIVFFGEGLPERFFDLMDKDFNDDEIDLVVCAGTSLKVHPFAQLPDMVSTSCDRLLLNAERVGSFGRRRRDVVVECQLDDLDELLPFVFSESTDSAAGGEEDLAAELEQLELAQTSEPGPASPAAGEPSD